MGKQVVLGLAGVVAILIAITGALVGHEWWDGIIHPRHGAPSVMIISSTVLEQAARIGMQRNEDAKNNEDSKNREDAKSNLAGNIENRAIKAGDRSNGKTPEKPSSDEADRDKNRTKTDSFSLEVGAIQESLDGKVSQDIDNSRRFTLVAQARVTDALVEFARDQKIAPQSLFQVMFGGSDTISSGKKSELSGNSETTEVLSQGITTIAKKVRADYTLIISVGNPEFTVDVIPGTNDAPVRIVMVAQPEVNCEIFDSKTGRAYRFANQISKPLTETVVVDPQIPLKAQILTKLTRLDDRISEAASQQVLALILDKVAPARIVLGGDHMVINRGTNDGLTEGAVYPVKREVGEDIKEDDSGADLGKRRIDVGSIVVESADAAKSTVTVASGGPFLKGDIVVMALPTTPGPRPAATAASKPSGQPTVAVDHIMVGPTESLPLGDTISSVLAADSRIAVLSRAQMANLKAEQSHNSMASGDFGMSPEEGMRQSDYLVSGQCSSTSHSRTNSISIGGVSEPVSTSVSHSASCTLRATAVDGRMLGSETGDGGSLDAAANAAARALLARMLPAMGLGVAPSEAPAVSVAAPSVAAAPPVRQNRPPAHRQRPKSEPKESGIHF